MVNTITAVIFVAIILHAVGLIPRATALLETPPLPTRSAVAACPQTAWPYYEANCLARNATSDWQVPVRVILTDRLPHPREAPLVN